MKYMVMGIHYLKGRIVASVVCKMIAIMYVAQCLDTVPTVNKELCKSELPLLPIDC